MIEKVYYYDCDNLNVYHNLAMQKYIFHHIPDDSMVFLMWKNNESIILPRDKSPYNEINVSQLELEHAVLARKNNNGHTLYNDLGCLNYAFFVYLNNYDAAAQVNAIYQALCRLELPVYLNEQQEILLDSKVIVENSFAIVKECCMMQGTIYWDSDKAKRSRLLKDNKYKSKLGNITDNYPCTNLQAIKKNLLQSIADKYGPVYPLSITDTYDEYINDYQSFEYIYQVDKPYSLVLNVQLTTEKSAQIYVDMIKNKIIKFDMFLEEEDNDFSEVAAGLFNSLYIDSGYFKAKMIGIEQRYLEDLLIIYRMIKKNCYPI